MNHDESGKQAARHILVEIADACRWEAKYSNWIAGIPLQSDLWKRQTLVAARPILQDYDASTVEELV